MAATERLMNRSRHWAQMGEHSFVAGIWILYWVHRLAGRRFFRGCMAPVLLLHWALRPQLRAVSMQYLQRLHAHTGVFAKPPGAWQSLRHVGLFAETMLDKLLAMAGKYPAEQVQSFGHEALREAARRGQGGILITAHMGCLELCRALAADLPDFRLNVLVHTAHAKDFNRVLQRLNPGGQVQLIEVSEVDAAMAMLLSDKVSAGEFVAIAGDRVPVRQSKTVAVDFLGHAAHFPVGPYVLASLLKCPLYSLSCLHEGKGYALRFELLSAQVILPRGRREEALKQYAAQYAALLAQALQRSPYDWFNFFPFWDQGHELTSQS